jgi:DNA polymerase IV
MNYGLNTEDPKIMWIDLNSAFATTEQQAHPSLRGRPLGITNRFSKNCCIITASYEAKRKGVKVGMPRLDALAICPDMLILESDPPKYHHVYKKLLKIMQDYSPDCKMKSIDEGVIDFHGSEQLLKGRSLKSVGYEIKDRVRKEIGDYMMINIGIGPNRFLAKTAAGLHKPDGLDIIDHTNLIETFETLKLTDLTGIASRYKIRLNSWGIFTPLQFLEASEQKLSRQVFGSINGLYWHRRLRGFEIDNQETHLGMVGRQWVLKAPSAEDSFLNPCLHFLAETTAVKLRHRGVVARGVCVWIRFQAGGRWKGKRMYKSTFFSNQDVWKRARELFNERPKHLKAQTIGIYLYQLTPNTRSQLNMFEDVSRMEWLTEAVDEINELYGTFTVHSADSLLGKSLIKQKIPFGGTQYFDLLLKRQ